MTTLLPLTDPGSASAMATQTQLTEALVRLLGRMVNGAIALYRIHPFGDDEPFEYIDGVSFPVVRIDEPTSTPQDRLRLEYWVSGTLEIELYWIGSEPFNVSADGVRWTHAPWTNSYGMELGHLFTSPLMPASEATHDVKRTLTISTGTNQASFDLCVELHDATTIKPPTASIPPLKATPGSARNDAELDPLES
jgi:hypothetical protein